MQYSAERYERTADREAYRAGHHERKLATTSGEVTIRMPKPEGMRLATAIIERYRRRETSVEEAMIETCLAGVSIRRIEDAGEILWGFSVSAATVSNLNERAFEAVEEWHSRPLERAYPYACADGIYLRRGWGGSHENVAVMVAMGADDDGYREVIGAAEGLAESSECWREFLSWLRSRGLRGVRMLSGDKAAGMVGSIAEVFPDAACQRRVVHFYRNVLARVPKSKRPRVAAVPRAIHAMEPRGASEAKAGTAEPKGRVVVIGGGLVGTETAEYLLARGCQVAIVEMLEQIATGESGTILPTIMAEFAEKGVEQHVSTRVTAITDAGVEAVCGDEAVTIPCDAVVMAVGSRAVTFDAGGLDVPVTLVGDCSGERTADIASAIRTAYAAANQL